MMMDKRGVFYTISLYFLGMLVLTLAVLGARHSASLSRQSAQFSAGSSVLDLDLQGGDIMARAWRAHAGWTVQGKSTWLTFSHGFPVQQSGLAASLEGVRVGLEAGFEGMGIDLAPLTNGSLFWLPSLLNVSLQGGDLVLAGVFDVMNISVILPGNVSCAAPPPIVLGSSVAVNVSGDEGMCAYTFALTPFNLSVDNDADTFLVAFDGSALRLSNADGGSLRVQAGFSSAVGDVLVLPIDLEVNRSAFGLFTKRKVTSRLVD